MGVCWLQGTDQFSFFFIFSLSFQNGMIVHILSGRCMEAVGQENNKDLYLRECDGKASQLWHFDNVSTVDERWMPCQKGERSGAPAVPPQRTTAACAFHGADHGVCAVVRTETKAPQMNIESLSFWPLISWTPGCWGKKKKKQNKTMDPLSHCLHH